MNTKTNTKTRTKYRKDQACGTFSTSREDIEYDILSALSEHHTKTNINTNTKTKYRKDYTIHSKNEFWGGYDYLGKKIGRKFVLKMA